MSKQDYIFRYFSIIKKLRRNGEATFKEIAEYLKRESDFEDMPVTFSNRTFQRDLNEIRSLFKVDIRYDFSRKVYFIADDPNNDLNNRMLESIDTINSLKMVSDVTKYMFFEKRKARGTHHFHGLLHAIKNRVVIKLVHQKYDDDEPTTRLIEPLALKESEGRWYLFAKDTNDKRLKTFGLDRVLDFEFTAKRFDYPHNLDVNAIFKNCFGVINLEDKEPENVVLSFKPEQGKYIKSYPLHESQTVVSDDKQGLVIKLHIWITHDLIMEILSYGDTVKVVSPARLGKQLRKIYTTALDKYR